MGVAPTRIHSDPFRHGQLRGYPGTFLLPKPTSARLPHASPFKKTLHKSLAPFSPYIPASLLPHIALVLIVSTFVLTFYCSTSVPSVFTLFAELMDFIYTAFQKTVSLFGKAQSRHSQASLAVSVWLPFSVA